MDRVLRLIFARLIRAGNLRVTAAGGSTFTFGDGTGTRAAIRFTTRAAQRRVLLDPALKFGEEYMDGGVVVEAGSIADVLAIPSALREPARVGTFALPHPLSAPPH
jgi:cyclopropane-fatty-acyl-phospholipid synthase